MKPQLHTRWQAMELIVARDGHEIDRVGACDIERVIMVYRDRGDTPGDLAFAVLQTREHDLLLPAESGIAGRVHFERQLFWSERRCVYWAPLAKAALPRQAVHRSLDPAPVQAGVRALATRRVAAADRAWPLEGPQSWDERKVARIARARPFPAMRPAISPNSTL